MIGLVTALHPLPNVHPMIVHFPVVLLLVAAVVSHLGGQLVFLHGVAVRPPS